MYITTEELISEGATGTLGRLTNAIVLAQEYIEKMTGQWFETKDITLKFDGKKQKIIFLPVYAFSISMIKEDDDEISSDDYYLYNDILQGARGNPKIVFETELNTGYQNIEVTGKFGYVESDESTPPQIKKICKKLALNDISLLADSSRRDIIDRGRIIGETTDSHSYKLGELLSSGGFTGDPEIDQILKAYRAPINIAGV